MHTFPRQQHLCVILECFRNFCILPLQVTVSIHLTLGRTNLPYYSFDSRHSNWEIMANSPKLHPVARYLNKRNNNFLLFSDVQLQKKWKYLSYSYFREIRGLKSKKVVLQFRKKENTNIHILNNVSLIRWSQKSFQLPRILSVLQSQRQKKHQHPKSSQIYHLPQKTKATEDVIGLELVNVLKQT